MFRIIIIIIMFWTMLYFPVCFVFSCPTYGACCHISLPFFRAISRKSSLYTVLMKQNHIIVPDMWEINMAGNKYLTQTEKVKKHYIVPGSHL